MIGIRHISVATSERPAVFMPFPADINMLSIELESHILRVNSERCLGDTQRKLMSGNVKTQVKNIKIHHNVRLHNVKQQFCLL